MKSIHDKQIETKDLLLQSVMPLCRELEHRKTPTSYFSTDGTVATHSLVTQNASPADHDVCRACAIRLLPQLNNFERTCKSGDIWTAVPVNCPTNTETEILR